jgi:hypothetical protein
VAPALLLHLFTLFFNYGKYEKRSIENNDTGYCDRIYAYLPKISLEMGNYDIPYCRPAGFNLSFFKPADRLAMDETDRRAELRGSKHIAVHRFLCFSLSNFTYIQTF